MGEIGISPDRFRYGLQWWEIQSIISGNNRRKRDMWSATRWQTFHILAAVCGGKNLRESGIHSVKDLLPFPWEGEGVEQEQEITDEEIAQMQAEMRAINAGLEKKA